MRLVLRFFYFLFFFGWGELNSTQHRSLLVIAGSHCNEEEVSLVRQLAASTGSRTAPVAFIAAILELTFRQKTGFLPGKSRQVMLFTPCHIVSINRENLKILIRCQESVSHELTVDIFPSGGSRCMRGSRVSC